MTLWRASVLALLFLTTMGAQSQSYFNSCEGLLAALRSGDVENFFISGARTDTQMIQILMDYGIVASANFNSAILLALQNEGIPTGSLGDIEEDLKNGKVLAGVLERIADAPEPKFQEFMASVLGHLEDLAATNPDTLYSRVEYLRTQRFLKSLQVTEQRVQFYKIVKEAIRSTLKLTASRIHQLYAEDSQRRETHRHYVRRAIWLGYGALSVGSYFLLSYLLSPESQNTWVVPIVMSPFFGALVTDAYRGSVAKWSWKLLNPQNKPFLPEISVPVTDLTETASSRLGNSVISLEQACQTKSLCQLTPLQIAYLGHLEIIQLQTLKEDLQKALRSFGYHDNFSEIRDAAVDVRANPDSYSAQITFKARVRSLIKNFSEIEAFVGKSTTAMNKTMETTQFAMKRLREKPYDVQNSMVTPEFINKNQMLIYKFQTDLETLEAVRMDESVLRTSLAALRPLLDELEQLTAAAVDSEADWDGMATQVILALDSAGSGGGSR